MTAIAQASLCETLLKLNTGLVNIISSFLRCGKKEVNLDYKSLISLSDTSRVEAVDALNRLSQRLSQSSFTTLRPSNHCSRCGKSRHEGKCLTKAASTELLTKKKHKHARACPRTKAAAQDQAAHIRKVQLYNASEPQLAMVKSRPRNHRVNSSSSANSPMPSPPPSYKSLSPPQSPPFPGYQAPNTGYFPPQYTPSPPLADPRHLRKNNPSGPANTPPPIPRKPTKYRTEAAKLAQLSSSQLNTMPQVQTPVVPRRQDKTTPSVYTFASDSTKLGEIPMDRWNVPYDWSAAERGNREAALKPVPGPPAVVLEGKGGGGKKGLFKGLFKKKDKEGGWLGSY